MKRHSFLAFASVALITGFSISSAQAVVSVIGGGMMAYNCFIGAKSAATTGVPWGLSDCDAALAQDNLSVRDRAGTFVNRGVLQNALGNHAAALADYEAGLHLKADLGDAYVDRGAALISLEKYDAAMADINKGINLGLSYPHIGYFDRGVAEELMGKYKESYADFKHVLELEPGFTMASDQLKNFTVTTVRKP